MFRYPLVVSLFIVLTSLTTEIAFSRPLSPSPQYPEAQSEVNLPICYIQRADVEL